MRMLENTKTPPSSSITLALLLALIGGYLDGYTYFCRGQVFANAQTGNVILLGLNIANGKFTDAWRYLLPILAFILGVLFANKIKSLFRSHPYFHWRQIIVLIECFLLFIIGFIPGYHLIINTLISFVCSLQVESFRKVNDIGYASTMCTGNLRQASALLYMGLTYKDKNALKASKDFFCIILSFILGAILSMYVSRYIWIQSIWLGCVLLMIVFLMMFTHSSKNTV